MNANALSGSWGSRGIRDGRALDPPAPLCSINALPPSGLAGDAYDVAPDGQRFLVKVPARRPSIIVMSNAFARVG